MTIMVLIFISKSQNVPLIVDKREDHILIEIIDKIQRYSPVVCCGSPSESRPTCKHYCCDKPDKEDKPKPTTHKPLDSGGNSSPKSTKKPPINNVPQPSTYVVCFSFENILTIIEFRHDNHFIHDCVIFDQTIEERKQQSHYYMEYYAVKNRTFFSHQIDFNIMLLMIRSCTMNAFEQQQQLQVTHNTGNINVYVNLNPVIDEISINIENFVNWIPPKTKWQVFLLKKKIFIIFFSTGAVFMI